MLVLSRKIGERLVIGGNITVVVNRVAGNRVTLGIEAPDTVRIVRGELEATKGYFAHLPSSKEPHAEFGARNFDSSVDTSSAPLRLAK
ncbi:MAG: carbon storage regulator [Pirellulaceae bacterium]|nr:carbon storage regulator [Pirellulaceae bacterium]